jgi:hypothetical protein
MGMQYGAEKIFEQKKVRTKKIETKPFLKKISHGERGVSSAAPTNKKYKKPHKWF